VLLWGGVGALQQLLEYGDLFVALSCRLRGVLADEAAPLAHTLVVDAPAVLDSTPPADAVDVAVDSRIVVRFAGVMDVQSLNRANVTLIGPAGPIPINIVPVENGVLLFVTPTVQFLPASAYTLFIKGARDTSGKALPFTALGFSTAHLAAGSDSAASAAAHTAAREASDVKKPSASPSAAVSLMTSSAAAKRLPDDGEEWFPDAARHFHGSWKSGRDARTVQALEPLKAPPGVTALAGQVLTLHGRPLDNAELSIAGRRVTTDETGRFC
jgi:hypothetical protein